MSQGAVESPGLFRLLNGHMTPELVHRAANQLGENEDRTRAALEASVPSVLATLSDAAASPGGATQLSRALGRLERHGDRAGVPDEGVVLFDAEAGARAGSIAEAVSRASGVSAESAHQLLGTVTGAALAMLHQNYGPAGLEAIRSTLDRQRRDFVRRLPAPVAPLFDEPRTAPTLRELPPRRRPPGWLVPLALLAGLFILAIPLLHGLRHGPPRPLPARIVPQAAAPTVPATVPAPPRAATPPSLQPPPEPQPRGGSVASLADFLAGQIPTPARFALHPLNFDPGSTRLTPQSRSTVSELARTLAAHPEVSVRVESFTDDRGRPEANQRISQARSRTVRDLLVHEGIEPSRVEAAGRGAANPLGSNATESGRAANRRTEIVVLRR